MTAIIIATDGSLSSERAVHIGADVATARRADVFLVSVIDDKPIPEGIKALAAAEHLVDGPPAAQGTHMSNIPMWMAEGVHAAVQAERNIEIRRTLSTLAINKARDILGHAGVTQITDKVIEGDAADAIVQTATQHKAEMIIMGSRGLGAVKSLVFGSTSQQVASRATCSCITVT